MTCNILFITYIHLGDAILNTSILQHFIKKYPESKITVIVGKSAAPIYKAYSNVVKIYPIIKKQFGLHWFLLWTQVCTTKWDIVVDCRHSYISLFLNTNKRFYKMNKHVKNTYHFSQRMSYFLNEKNIPYPHVPIKEDLYKKTEKMLNKNDGAEFITIAPTTNWPPKTWPIENYCKLVKKILKHPSFSKIKFIITAAPNEFSKCKPLLDVLKDKAISLINEDIMTTAAALKFSTLFLGNDSGLMHLAAATNTPLIALFGPTPQEIYSPFGCDKSLIINAPLDKIMSSLTVDEVYRNFYDFYFRLSK